MFVPTRFNIAHAEAVLDLTARVGARTFVSGPMMRLGRAAAAWSTLAPSPEEWAACARRLEERGKSHPGGRYIEAMGHVRMMAAALSRKRERGERRFLP